MTRRPAPVRFSLLLRAAVIVAMAVGLLVFAPTVVGGRATYIMVTGNSMEPGLSRGDLVIARAHPAYAVGDTVVYEHPQLGRVIHRIIDREGDRFVFKGDNNDFIDGHQPTRSELVGQRWLAIPHAGWWLTWIRQPLPLAVLLTLSLFGIGAGLAEPERRKRRYRQRQPLPLVAPFATEQDR